MKVQLINLDPVREQIKTKLIEQYQTTTFMNTDEVELKVSAKEIIKEYLDQQQIKEPRVCITTEAYSKMRLLVDKFEKELGWYGIVTEMPGINTFVIEDLVVYPQKVTGTTCEQDEDKMFDFEMSLTTEQVNKKRFHGHSHVSMGAFASSTDENFYQELLKQVTDYFIITITNKRNEYCTRFYDVRNNVLYTDVPIELINADGHSMLEWYEEQEKKLITRTYTAYTPSKNWQSSLFKDDYDFDYDPYCTTRSYSAAEQAKAFERTREASKLYYHKAHGYLTREEWKTKFGAYPSEAKAERQPKRVRGRPRKDV